MIKTGFPELETARLVLRRPAAADLDEWTRRIFADPDVMRYLPRRDLTPRERAERALQNFEKHWAQRGYGMWVMIDKANGRFLGHCGLNYLEETDEVEV